MTVIDVTDRIITSAEYDSKLKNFDLLTRTSLSSGYINLNRNTYECANSDVPLTMYDVGSMPYDAMLHAVARNIVGDGSMRRYLDLFDRKNLLRKAERGEMHAMTDFLYRFSDKHTVWVEAMTDLVRNPENGEIEGLCYARDVQNIKFSSLLMKKALNLDYPMMAVIVADTDEFYTVDTQTGTYKAPRSDFWDSVASAIMPIAVNMSREQIEKKLNKDEIINYLKTNQEYRFSFNSTVFGRESRVEFKCGYLTESRSLLIAYIRNITDEGLLSRYKYESEHDPLTGLLNRATQFKACRRLLEAHPDEQFAILHLDVKKFHLYNTFFGDEAGDRLLTKIALLFTNMGKDYDHWSYGRIESDVFCAFFPVDRGYFEPHLKYFLREMALYSKDFPLEFGMGAYYVTDRDMSIEAMFSRATIAAKSGKTNLFGFVSLYDENMEKELMDTHQITSMMQSAVNEEQFCVYMQPQYSLRSGRIVGAEALVRWRHPERGLISPGTFIPIFEKNGFIATLDRYMWEHVCSLIRRWLDEGRRVLPVSVNISRASMYSHNTVTVLKELVARYDIDPQYLGLELTESAYMDDPEDLKRMLNELQSFGFRIFMDDFGSGYSSLNTLKELPVDVLKLDMKLISDSLTDKRAATVLASVIRMSKLLDLPIVAEGVETMAQAEYLKSLGCEFVQGFYFARPMPAIEYEVLMEEAEPVRTAHRGGEKSLAERFLLTYDTPATILADNFPLPLAILEYRDGRFIFDRANDLFIEKFHLTDAVRSASRSFLEHLSGADYSNLISGFERCAEEKGPCQLTFCWNEEDGSSTSYIANLAYKGNIGSSAMILISFTPVPA